MAESGPQLDKEFFYCSVCLDLLKDPVTIPCGHSYCMSCVNSHWNGEVGKQSYSCPQCRQNFTQRPVLVKNTMLAVLVEGLKKSGPPVAPVSHCYAEHGDVACDLCSGRKLKAVKSCLQCLVSYCTEHLQPHYDVAALKKHKLVEPTESLQDNICSRHDEVMKMFCRTDRQCICYLCSVDEHKGHDTVTAAAERTKRQKVLDSSKQKILQTIDEKEKEVYELQHKVNNMSHSADTEVVQKNKSLQELISLIEKRMTEVKQQVRSQQEAEECRVKDLQDKLQQEITELKRKHTELDKLSHTEDHYQFLHKFGSLSKINDEPDSSTVYEAQLPFFDMVTAAVRELKDKLRDIENQDRQHESEIGAVPSTDAASQGYPEQEMDNRTNILHIFAPNPPVPVSRDEFLQYACDVTLDPNTAHIFLALSAENRRVKCASRRQSHRKHPERFTQCYQVLSKEALTGRCYIEMNVNYFIFLTIAVAYKDIQRKGPFSACGFGKKENSWSLVCYSNDIYHFLHNNKIKEVMTEGHLTRIGIFLDHDAGILAFYKLNEPKNLIHEICTTFTQPLYLGIGFDKELDYAEICKLT